MRPRRLAVALVLAALPASADDWNTGVGGNAARSGLSDEAGPAGPFLLWDESLPAVVAQQAVTEGNVAVMPRMFDIGDVIGGTDIVAHDLTTGEILWNVQVPASFGDSWRNRVTAIRGGRVFATRSGNANAEFLYALDAADGSILWVSDDLVTETSTESATFTAAGDVVTSGVFSVICISAADGSTVWETPRTCPSSGGCDPIVFGNRVYAWESGGFAGVLVTAFDATTGARLYSSPIIAGGIVQEIGLLAGPDGTIYAPRSQNNPATDYFVALEDTGAAFVEKWRFPMGYVPFASCGVGPDGSVYTYDRDERLVRLDPATGLPVGASALITSDFYQPRLAIGAAGTVYVTNGGYSQGRLFAFAPDLSPLFSVPVPNVNVGGPALGENGVLVVCGTGTDVRAYYTEPPLRLVRFDPGGAGADNTLRATFATPLARVHFVAGFRNGSPAVPGCPGTALGIRAPRLLGAAFADALGVATLSFRVPARASGRAVLVQAAELGNCTVSPVLRHDFP